MKPIFFATTLLISASSHAGLLNKSTPVDRFIPAMIEDVTQRLVKEMTENDSLVRSAKGEFDLSKTNIEENRVFVKGSLTFNPELFDQVARANEQSVSFAEFHTQSSYQAVMSEESYGLKLASETSGRFDVLRAFRLAAQKVYGTLSPYHDDRYEDDAREVLNKITKAENFSQLYDLLNEINSVARESLNHELTERLARLNGGSSSEAARRCRMYSNASDGSIDPVLFEECMRHEEQEFHSFEAARILQQNSPLVKSNTSSGFSIRVDQPGKLLSSLIATENNLRKAISGIVSETAMITVEPLEMTVSTTGFMSLKKLEFLKIEQKFKNALVRYQSEEPVKMDVIKGDIREALIQIKRNLNFRQ